MTDAPHVRARCDDVMGDVMEVSVADLVATKWAALACATEAACAVARLDDDR